ncbi:M23 family metallopeptidase [Myxosarcina sp. GI1]|uniref:M23 family metallopeptidase n=1 Tax=Myxosarcina sp. GI1 TaxID=1541065 RepID=UPI000561EE8E|nr:M23 family metallopeptidase [Myxosarcina sp. GI1]
MLNALRSISTWAATTFLIAIPTAVNALEVDISPKAPQMGDTISVLITPDDNTSPPPIVNLEEKNYPVFPLGDRYRALIPTSPLDPPGKMTVRVEGEESTSNIGVWLKNRVFPIQRIWLTGKASRPATDTELEKVAEFKSLVTPQKFWNGTFTKPSSASVSTVFGVRRYYNGEFANDYYHKGVDYAGSSGSLVVAPTAGKVRLIGREDEDFHVHGNTIGIDHGQGVVSIFMHLQDIYVREGDMVQPGQRIGTVGSSGASTGPHLHWGLYVNGIAVDPVPWRFTGIE